MKNRIIFIRHGKSLGNEDQSYYLLPDPAIILSKTGVDECITLMKRLPEVLHNDRNGHVFTTFITSEFTRAKMTANIVLSQHPHHSPILHDRRLNEVYWCETEMKLVENRAQVKKRILSLIEQYPFNLVLFCHGQMMDAIDYKRGRAYNCEVRDYDRDDLIANYLLSTDGDELPLYNHQ